MQDVRRVGRESRMWLLCPKEILKSNHLHFIDVRPKAPSTPVSCVKSNGGAGDREAGRYPDSKELGRAQINPTRIYGGILSSAFWPLRLSSKSHKSPFVMVLTSSQEDCCRSLLWIHSLFLHPHAIHLKSMDKNVTSNQSLWFTTMSWIPSAVLHFFLPLLFDLFFYM